METAPGLVDHDLRLHRVALAFARVPAPLRAHRGTPSPEKFSGFRSAWGNYTFAKQVADMFVQLWGAADLPESERKPMIWQQLILHYEAFRRGSVSDILPRRTCHRRPQVAMKLVLTCPQPIRP